MQRDGDFPDQQGAWPRMRRDDGAIIKAIRVHSADLVDDVGQFSGADRAFELGPKRLVSGKYAAREEVGTYHGVKGMVPDADCEGPA